MMKPGLQYFLSFVLIFCNTTEAQNSCVEISSSQEKIKIDIPVIFLSKNSVTCHDCDSNYRAEAYLWKFENAEPSTALGPGPHEVKFLSPGNFEVQLEVTYIHPENFEKECKKTSAKKIAVEASKEFVLNSFTVQSNNKRIILNWSTFFDDEIDLYSIEKSADTSNFIEIATVKKETDNLFSNDYTTDDKNPSKGLAYYRLKYKNINGVVKYSNPVAVKWIDISELLNVAEGEKVLVVINDKDGNEIYSKVVVKGIENDAIVAIDPAQKILPGKYHIVGSSKNEIHNKEMVIVEK